MYLHPQINMDKLTAPPVRSHGTSHPPHPMKSLALLLALVLAGVVVGSTLSAVAGTVFVTGTFDPGTMTSLMSGSVTNIDFLRIVQIGASLGAFLIPPIVLSIVEKSRTSYLPMRMSGSPLLWLFPAVILLCGIPVLEHAIRLNQGVRLPDPFATMQHWLEEQEKEANDLIDLLMSDTTTHGLVFNLIVIALVPAIAEEFLFRGGIQTILTRWTKNPHTAIWLTAAIFSIAHLQFSGLLARMLLGALFGYLLFWGKNIWFPVLAHFVNNAVVVISMFEEHRHGSPSVVMSFPPMAKFIVSAILTAALLSRFYRIASRDNVGTYGEKLD